MDIRNNERISMESDQYSMQQQQPIQYINIDHDSGHSGSSNEHTFAPDNVQGASTMTTIPDNASMAREQQYTHEMAHMSDINQQMQQQQQQHHVMHDDQNAAQNLILSNEIQMQPTLCEFGP